METYTINKTSLFIEIGAILILVNIFVYIVSFSTTPLSIQVILLLNAGVLAYFGTRKYVTKVAFYGDKRTLEINQMRVGRVSQKLIKFENLRYAYKWEDTKRVPRIFPNLVTFRTLRLFFDREIVKMTQNHLGWVGDDLDQVVYWLDIHKIPRKELHEILEDEDAFPESYE